MQIKYANYVVITDNIGDNAQVYALDQLYQRMGIPAEDVVYMNRDTICDVVDEDCHYILPLVTADIVYFDLIEYLMEHHMENQFSFLPLSIGQTRWTFVNEKRLERFCRIINTFESPIGCRDYDSASMYESLGYQTYVNGCITNTLPRRREGHYDKVYVIDAPPNFLKGGYIPEELSSRASILTQEISPEVKGTAKEDFKRYAARYDLLRDTAALVITSRYHIATPCCAMGIPVIMLENCDQNHHWTFDPRFSALNAMIPFYTKEQWDTIDWEPRSADFEDTKQTMIELAASRIGTTAHIVRTIAKLDQFFLASKDRFWSTFCENRYKIDYFGFSYYLETQFLRNIKGNFRYYLYGLSDRYIEQKECLMLDYIQRNFSKAEFLGFVDSRKKGHYFGKDVIAPDDMEIDENTYCLVSAYTANDFATQLFEAHGFDKAHLWQMPKELLFYVYHL